MSHSNRYWVDEALLLLRDGLRPFVERKYQATYGTAWEAEAQTVLDTKMPGGHDSTNLDIVALLTLIRGRWVEVFQGALRRDGRNLVNLLLGNRHNWAHQEQFSDDDVQFVLHGAYQLLTIVHAPEAQEIQRLKSKFRRERFDEHEPTADELVTAGRPSLPVNELDEQLFNLELDASHPAAERDRMRRELAMRLNGTRVDFSLEDELLLIGVAIRAGDITRPVFDANGIGSLKISRHPMRLETTVTVPLLDERNPFGFLYPRWQYPNDAGGSDETGEQWTPFIVLEHPRPGAWIATTVAAGLNDNEPRHSRETFIFDAASRYWRRTIDQRGMAADELLLQQHGDQLAATPREMNECLDRWLERWVALIDETL